MMPPLRTLKIANSAILSYNPRNLLEKRFQTRNRITNHNLQKKLSRDTRPLFGISYQRLLYWCGSGRLLIALREPQEGGSFPATSDNQSVSWPKDSTKVRKRSRFGSTRAHRAVRLRSGRQDWTHDGIIKSQNLSKLVWPREAILQCPGLATMVLSFLSQQTLQRFEGSRCVNLGHYDNVFWWTDQDPNKTDPIQRQLSSHRGSNLSQSLRPEGKQKTNLG